MNARCPICGATLPSELRGRCPRCPEDPAEGAHRFGEHLGVSTHPPKSLGAEGPPRRASRARRGPKPLLTTLALLGVLVGLLGAWWFLTTPRKPTQPSSARPAQTSAPDAARPALAVPAVRAPSKPAATTSKPPPQPLPAKPPPPPTEEAEAPELTARLVRVDARVDLGAVVVTGEVRNVGQTAAKDARVRVFLTGPGGTLVGQRLLWCCRVLDTAQLERIREEPELATDGRAWGAVTPATLPAGVSRAFTAVFPTLDDAPTAAYEAVVEVLGKPRPAPEK